MIDRKRKISVIGAGFVGATAAYALMNSGVATEICLFDINMDKAMGEVMDLVHGTSFVKPVSIYAGSIEETKDSDIVIITAGAAQKEGETRLDLIEKNYKIFKSFVPQIAAASPNAILLVVSNPCDVLAYITYKLSGFPRERVIASGTVLDSSRLKYVVGKYFNVNNNDIHAYVLGEHGDSEVVSWSTASIAGGTLDEYADKFDLEWDEQVKAVIENDVKNAAYEIISRKNATYFAVALAVNRIVEAILRDENAILTVSCLMQGEYGIDDVYLAVPTIVNSTGVVGIVNPVIKDAEELGKLQESAKVLKEHIKKVIPN
ncbi:L-lactate dehydrogenase [Clostridium saccharoperbutylacetonicum]|uniref:L-lactate dehydrogenase n=1 Tax=Clostridium saccharoperbutylacetonicum N1-4(HMT) TaxID=931276 RepID=M1MES6_9CLOT|nr:L-lactate dehydrogenase [Clostridium saccharoperbutylacetonicum]AGF54873.1 L-lactate dehydrogenase 1 [Clostridium saccharoperbutylacetonicum N1-4(HMT)]NRT64422.1 L-lactate dehydrogenase [Clostridium saccharoperbutylacetonicum]NSB27793.1 L-lactate dehydrogenase [Clostridium saccharoperbutylacetonicum]NSB41278.1 L-lactate dehydrogenase [Clostridium saccharoperbutylacetonicum]